MYSDDKTNPKHSPLFTSGIRQPSTAWTADSDCTRWSCRLYFVLFNSQYSYRSGCFNADL